MHEKNGGNLAKRAENSTGAFDAIKDECAKPVLTDPMAINTKGVWKNLLKASRKRHGSLLLEKPTEIIEFAIKLDLSNHNGRKKGKLMTDFMFYKSVLKLQAYKEPKKKGNHDNLQYDMKIFPWSEIWRKAETSDDSLPSGFTTSNHVHTVKVTEGTDLSPEICKLFLGDELKSQDTDLWKFFATIKMTPGTPFLPVLGKLQQYRNHIQLGVDYVHVVNDERHWDKDHKVNYIHCKNMKAAMLCGFLIGSEAEEYGFLSALSRYNLQFNQQFTHENGQIDKLVITYHDHEWFAALKDIAIEMMEDCNKLTIGQIRFGLSEHRYQIRKKCFGNGETPLDIKENSLDFYYPNKLFSLHERTKGLKLRGEVRKVWKASKEKKHVLLVNALNNVVKYFRNFDWDKAKAEAEAMNEITEAKKKGLSNHAKRIAGVNRSARADDLRRVTLDNKFLRNHPRDFLLHPRFYLVFEVDEDIFGTLKSAEIGPWRYERERMKQPAEICNIQDQYNMEEVMFAQQIFLSGANVPPDTMKSLFALKGRHDRQYKKNSKETAYIAAYAASTRNEMRHQVESSRLAEQMVKHAIDATRVDLGLGPMFDHNDDVTTEEKMVDFNNASQKLEEREKQVEKRNGHFPIVDTGEQILAGKDDNLLTVSKHNIANCNKFSKLSSFKTGQHYRSAESGLSEKEESERGIKRSSTDQIQDPMNEVGYSQTELNEMASEEMEPKSKVRKEGDIGSDINLDISERVRVELDVSGAASNIDVGDEMQVDEGDNSLNYKKEEKKLRLSRVVPRFKQSLKDLEVKIKQNCKFIHERFLNISDAELLHMEFKVADFESIARKPYISVNGQVLYTLNTHRWEKRGINPKNAADDGILRQKISMADMQRSWYSLVLGYSGSIRTLLKGILHVNQKRHQNRLNHNLILEIAKLQSDLEVFEGGMNDSCWFDHFKQRDEIGKDLCPLPTLELYNTIFHYIPIIREKLEIKKKLQVKKSPTDKELIKQMQKIHTERSSSEHYPKGKYTKVTSKDSPTADLGKDEKGRRGSGKEVSELSINTSAVETNRGNILDESYDYFKYKKWLDENLTPQIRDFIANNPNQTIFKQNQNLPPNKPTKKANNSVFNCPASPAQSCTLTNCKSDQMQNISALQEHQMETGIYHINLDGAYNYDEYNEMIENGQIPVHNTEFRNTPPRPNKCSTPKKKEKKLRPDGKHIYAEEPEMRKCKIVEVSLDKCPEYDGGKITKMPLDIILDKDRLNEDDDVIMELYQPKFNNEKIDFQFGTNLLSNPIVPEDAEIKIESDGKIIRTKLNNARKKIFKRPNNIPVSISYCNINPPICNKIKRLSELDEFSSCSFLLISEVRSNMSLIESLALIPLGYKVFTHKATKSGQCLALILVKIDLEGDIEVVFDEAPCIIIRWKKNNKSLLIGCFYRPHAKSAIYNTDFSQDEFACTIDKMTRICDKVPAVIMGDANINIDATKLPGDHRVRRLFERSFALFERIKTGHTFIRKLGSDKGTKIDYAFIKGLNNTKLQLFRGRELIGNDGHMIMKLDTEFTINGILGTTIVKSRPKLDPNTVLQMGNGLYGGLMHKLDEAEKTVFEKYEVKEGEKFSNRKLKVFEDNDYCELAFDFFEQFFSMLQPETEREIAIYNNPTPLPAHITNMNITIMSLVRTMEEEIDECKKQDQEVLYKKLCKIRDGYFCKHKKIALLNKVNLNDDDIFQLAKALRPKLRSVQMTKEIFTADQLAEEYNRVYSGITKHIQDSEVTLDILQLIPRISKSMKFSFDTWLPTWASTETTIKNLQQCFNSLKPTTRGLNSSLYRDGIAMLPAKYVEIIDKMILYWIKGGNYPKKFLGGKLKSILKKGDAKLIKNRRFISVGNFFQQLLGKITASCVLAYCEFMGLLSDDQYGFRSRRSTGEAVASFMYKVASKSDKCMTITMFIDFSSAFFCVKKDLLIQILESFIDEESIIYFKSLLQPITATVVSDGIESEEINVPDFGVRQGGGDSPLHFNLVQNFIFEYVSIKPETRYDTRARNLQGFADDSGMISTDIKTVDAIELMEEGLDKVNKYVTSVGFCINPSKSEIFIYCKKNRRGEFGKVLLTSQGEITIKRIVNFLGLRINDELSFKPQFEHLMSRVVTLKHDIQELLRLGTCRQIIKIAFSKSSGVYLYGLGVQRVWHKYQYQKAQKEVNDLIRLVYGIKWENENSWRQSDLLRQVNWPPVRLQHAKAALFQLNKIATNKNIEYLYDKVNHHLRYPNEEKVLENRDRLINFEDDPFNKNYHPFIVLNKEDKRFMSKKIKHMFPLTVAHWFNGLPVFIKVLVGTFDFYRAVHVYYVRACWHRELRDCSLCKSNKVLMEAEIDSFEKLLSKYAEEHSMTLTEVNETLSEEFFASNDPTFAEYEDLQHIIDEMQFEEET